VFTTLYLVRNGATDWVREGRLTGRREIALSETGVAQAERLAERLKEVDFAEVLSSPLPRAVQTAERIAAPHRLDVARDPRLTDTDAGAWEGERYEVIRGTPEYQRLLTDPLGASPPRGERLADVRDRVVASIDQALSDNELGASVAIVSHAGPLRLLLAHYLALDTQRYHRLRIAAGTVSILRFDSERTIPRVLAMGWGGDLADILL
jgi:broad specificity phosphatase PhoE